MKTHGSKLAFLSVLLLTLFALPATILADNTLDGRAYVVVVDNEQDVLTFDNGTFHSSSCDEYGFGTGEYLTRPAADGIAFEAKTTSDKHGEMEWKGTIRGNEIEGNYHWTKKGWLWDRSKSVDFKGALQE